MRRKVIFALTAFAIVAAAFVAYLVVDRYFPWLFAPEPDPPALLGPAEGAVLAKGHGTPAAPFAWEFTWAEVPRAERYEVVVDNAIDPPPHKTAKEVEAPRHRVETSVIYFKRLEGWSWKVRVRVRGRWSQWSESRAFTLEPAQPDKRPPFHVSLWLPRFDGKETDGKWSPSHEEVTAALKDVPCLPISVTIYGDNNGRRMVQFPLMPSAESDLGDVAKALAKLGGDKKKPVAQLSLATSILISGEGVPAEEAKFAALKKELAAAQGIDWEKSDRVSGLALDEAGGAKFREIRDAHKKAGIPMGEGVEDK
jgi:hypothetical protein